MTEIAHFAAYDDVGRIVHSVTCTPQLGKSNMNLNGFSQFAEVVRLADHRQYYLPAGVLTPRPESTAVLEGSLLRGVPAGAQVLIEGQEYVADGTDIELAFEYPGTYLLEVEAFPQLAWSGEYVED